MISSIGIFQIRLLSMIRHTFAISTPVKFLTKSGTRVTILNTSSVSFSAPIVPLPLETIVIFLACDKGAATSAATYEM